MTSCHQVRHELNNLAELSGQEINTTNYIKNYLLNNNPDQLIQLKNNTGLIAIFNSNKTGNNLAFRADIDALPCNNKVKHLCGHDGHTAILLTFSDYLKDRNNFQGSVILIFQPSEEIGKGALLILESIREHQVKIDMIFGFHNLPAYSENQIIINPKTFASASNGLLIKFKGISAHASEPDKGINPASACASAILMLDKISQSIQGLGFTQTTLIYTKIGDLNFGISPDIAEIAITLRAFRDIDLELLNHKVRDNISRIAEWHSLNVSFEIMDPFPATLNNPEVTTRFKTLLEQMKVDYLEQIEPFRWSEDFGHYLQNYPGTFFGIGVGNDYTNLHNPDYDFNDNVILPTVNVLKLLLDK